MKVLGWTCLPGDAIHCPCVVVMALPDAGGGAVAVGGREVADVVRVGPVDLCSFQCILIIQSLPSMYLYYV